MSDPRRRLPSVSVLLAEVQAAGIADDIPRSVIVDAIRAALQESRQQDGAAPDDGWLEAVSRRIHEKTTSSLRRVINATGVVLHTNLGRAPLAEAARRAVADVLRYSTLEFDVNEGSRGSRQDHTRDLLCELTGAEDVLVVNNAASAVMLLLHACAAGGETIVSRGELVEIGGAFRIPEILARSGTALIEVGTTNRTRVRDYELAISPRTRVLLKVHRSNFEITGFTSETSIEELVALGRHRSIPAVHDIGSGLLVSLEAFGLRGEPMVRDSVATGAVTVFSGDKLLGGPQAGIIVGPSAVVRLAAGSPLARAFRPDKTALAALEATLQLYRDPGRALAEIPALSMLTATPDVLKRRARRLARKIPGSRTEQGCSTVGGGSFPGSELPTTLVVLDVPGCDRFLEELRAQDPPVIARATEQKVVLDVRTIQDDEMDPVAGAVRASGWDGNTDTKSTIPV